VNSAAVSGSSTFSAADKIFDSVSVVAVAVFLPFAFVQNTYLVEHFVPSHCSQCFAACQAYSAMWMFGQHQVSSDQDWGEKNLELRKKYLAAGFVAEASLGLLMTVLDYYLVEEVQVLF
jgi:hypothetical protein